MESYKRAKEFHLPIRKLTNDWARPDEEKAHEIALHLFSTSQPFPPNNSQSDEEIKKFLTSPFPMDLPIKKFKPSEIFELIRKETNPRKSPGHDLISGKILKEIMQTYCKAICQIFNSVIRINYFPSQWKVAEIIIILKPVKKS